VWNCRNLLSHRPPSRPPWLCRALGTLLRHRGPDDEGFLLLNTSTGAFQLAGGDDTPAAVYASEMWYTPRRHVNELPYMHANLALVSRRLSIQDLSRAGHMPMGVREGDIWLTFNGQVYNFHELRAELTVAGHTFESAATRR
jgi:asparagine synthase (glutamine-hydrolysing)